ncbi:farnesyl diphosphate synthase [Armatimonas sp.]|uniref:polyprenyl synthetase family protein n=1 Tax=Armatimonas sp. TaxID=1872638 RepID=UPI00286BCE5C|nr:farnesyl diphosphate synthase [Armatimonas sp.]
MSFEAWVAVHTPRVNAALDQLCPADGSRLREAMRYSLLAGGKRLRPLLCIAAAEAVGSNIEHVLPAACALEMIHTFSLIHDDLPAMDDDDLRRGLPTCHVKYGEALAILAGDALQALAFELTAEYPQLLRLLAHACGQMCTGQAEDIAAEGKPISLSQLKMIHANKTGALLKASVVSGGLIVNAPPTQLSALETYGAQMGVAFQIVDDILDLTGDDATLGKPAGSDLKHDKATYPKLVGLEESKRLARAAEQEALTALEIFGESAEPLREIARYIVERNT